MMMISVHNSMQTTRPLHTTTPPLVPTADSPALGQQRANLLQRQPFGLRIEPPHTNPTKSTNARIASKRDTGARNVHHGQKANPNEKVARPIGSRGKPRPERPDREREELGLLPGHHAKPDCVSRHVEYQRGEEGEGKEGRARVC